MTQEECDQLEIRSEEECLAFLKTCNQDYDKDIEVARRKRDNRKSIALNKWAYNNARFNVGDIIESQGTIIQIDQRIGRHSGYYGTKTLYIEYRGPQLTKKLQPRKDESRASIYDDGRDIKKINIVKEEL